MRTDPWTWTGPPETRFENPWLRVETRRGLSPGGIEASYGIVRFRRHAVGVLPIHADGSVTMVGQWRVPLEAWSREIPEGGIEADEDPLAGALRELAEETGLVAGQVRPILNLHLSNSVTDERASVYVAWALTEGAAAPDHTEVLEVERVPFVSLLDDVAAGRITDAITVAAVLRVHHMAITGALPEALARAMMSPPPGAPVP